MWYGYATLRQPLPGNCSSCADGCVGFVDLIMPSRVASVDKCIQSGWNAAGGIPGPNATIPGPASPIPGSNPKNPVTLPNKITTAPSGQIIRGYIYP